MDLVKRLEEYRDRERALAWEGTFAQYFEIATHQPSIAQLSHERIYNMIMAAALRPTDSANRTTNSSTRRSLALRSRSSRSSNISTRPPNAWRCASASCC